MRLGDTLEAAQEALRAILAGVVAPTRDETVGAVVGHYVASLEALAEAGERARSTASKRRGLLRSLGPFGAMRCGEVRHQHANDWLASRPRKQATRRGLASHLRAALNHGVEAGLISVNPLARWRVARAVSEPPELPTDDQLRRICDGAHPRAAEAFRFLADTGCRVGELRAIEARHLHGDRVVLPVWKCGRATGRPRTIWLPGRWPARLAELAAERPAGALFRRPDGSAWCDSGLSQAWRQRARRLGLRLRLGSLRHRSITRDLLAGEPMMVVAALHGTSAREIERTYSHVTSQAEALRAAVRRRAG